MKSAKFTLKARFGFKVLHMYEVPGLAGVGRNKKSSATTHTHIHNHSIREAMCLSTNVTLADLYITSFPVHATTKQSFLDRDCGYYNSTFSVVSVASALNYKHA